MEPQKKTTLTEGSVAKGMLLFALPIFISNLFQQLYNAADSLIVGNFLGGEALAAVGSSGSLIFLLTGFVNGVSLGAGVVVARYFGAKDWQRMRRTIDDETGMYLLRSKADCPEIDGNVLTPADTPLETGAFYNVTITDSDTYDLYGYVEEKLED